MECITLDCDAENTLLVFILLLITVKKINKKGGNTQFYLHTESIIQVITCLLLTRAISNIITMQKGILIIYHLVDVVLNINNGETI